MKVWKPDTQTSVEIGAIQVYDQMEDGLLGLALDPQFARNGWIYLFHSLPDTTLDPAGKKVGENLVCRYTLKGDTLDLASEFGTAWGNNLDTQLIRIAYAGKS